jgi:hypothetical protein
MKSLLIIDLLNEIRKPGSLRMQDEPGENVDFQQGMSLSRQTSSL